MSGYEIQLFMKDTGWRDGVSRERVCKGESGWQATMERMWGASKTRILTAITWERGDVVLPYNQSLQIFPPSQKRKTSAKETTVRKVMATIIVTRKMAVRRKQGKQTTQPTKQKSFDCQPLVQFLFVCSSIQAASCCSGISFWKTSCFLHWWQWILFTWNILHSRIGVSVNVYASVKYCEKQYHTFMSTSCRPHLVAPTYDGPEYHESGIVHETVTRKQLPVWDWRERHAPLPAF